MSKIILADDDIDDRIIIQDAIDSLYASIEILYANNGEQVWNMLQENIDSILPCLIVLDLNMPKMNGTETLHKLKTDERFKNIPVIIFSTSINPIEKEKCLLLGAHSYITKPVSFKEAREIAMTFLQFCKV